MTDTGLTDPLTRTEMINLVGALRDTVQVRLTAMDKAVSLFETNFSRIPTETDKQVGHLRDLHQERFDSVKTQFIERDTRAAAAEQAQKEAATATAEAAKVGVAAALQAQKEAAASQYEALTAAIAKSEASTVKQIDGILALLSSNSKALDEKIAAITGRQDRGEASSSTRGHVTERYEDQSGKQTALFIAAGALLISLVMGAVTLLRPPGGGRDSGNGQQGSVALTVPAVPVQPR